MSDSEEKAACLVIVKRKTGAGETWLARQPPAPSKLWQAV